MPEPNAGPAQARSAQSAPLSSPPPPARRWALWPRERGGPAEERVARLGRGALCLLFAGYLLLRRAFAHRGLDELFGPRFSHFYITEIVFALLVPGAIFLWARRRTRIPGGLPALLFLAWGAGHALWGLGHGDAYLVPRQSALCAYAAFYFLTVIYFHHEARAADRAARFAVGVALLCALLDSSGLYPLLSGWTRPVYGQMTLPLGILGLAWLAAREGAWGRRGAALAGVAFLGWVQARRFQSAVVLGLAAAVGFLIFLSAALWLYGRKDTPRSAGTLRRAGGLAAVLFAASVFVFLFAARSNAQRQEAAAWTPRRYVTGLFTYAETNPASTKTLRAALRGSPPESEVREAHGLQAALDAMRTSSARNNLWRLLVWQKMLRDWREGRPWLGAGVGRAWFYEGLRHTRYYSGEPRIGLAPHNSYLNLLYRYGVVGAALFGWLVCAVLAASWRALRERRGDALLEGVLLYLAYAAAFAFVTVGLEGPPYGVPFWLTLGLAAALSWRGERGERGERGVSRPSL